mgnify:CR=1 FL=1
MALPVAQCRRLTLDSHLHVWSTGDAPYPLLQRPPPELATAATYQLLREAARAAAVDGAVIVQPANHGFDHSYVSSALKAEPTFFRGCLLANPTLPPREAVRELERLHAYKFISLLELSAVATMCAAIFGMGFLYLSGFTELPAKRPFLFFVLPRVAAQFSSLSFIQFLSFARFLAPLTKSI